jgi:hypothetical protein
MSENYPMNPTEARERGTRGIMAAGAGIGLMMLNGLLFMPVFGRMSPLSLVLGGVLAFIGASGLLGRGKTSTDKRYGGAMLGVGLAIALLPGPVKFVIGLGGFGLLSYGAWNIVKFVKGLKNRA